jgi:hypothetical protein
MKLRSGTLGGLAAIVALVLTAVVYNLLPVRGSDHQDSPTTVARPGADITDVFVYPAASPANVVLQMDVDPLLAPGGPTTTAALDPQVLYQFKIAHGAPGVEDRVIQLLPTGAGTGQRIGVYGPFKPSITGTMSTIGTASLVGTVPFNVTGGTTLPNGMKVFVGPRSDPFFFDLFAFFKFLPDRDYKTAGTAAPPGTLFSFNFTPAEIAANPAFASCLVGTPTDALSSNHFNVLSIVIEAPRALIAPSSGSPKINVWATTSTTTGS